MHTSEDFLELKKDGCLFNNVTAAYPYTIPAIKFQYDTQLYESPLNVRNSNLTISNDNQKISDHSMITEINGYRTKRILENYKNNFFSPYMGNDVIEMNSIISKYISSATFDPKNAKLIDLLFGRVHTIKAHSLADDELKTNFCELENYFQDKNETLIGIIDYDFDKMQNRKINNITINPDQKKEIVLDKGDRLITIANFNNLEMVNYSQWLNIL